MAKNLIVSNTGKLSALAGYLIEHESIEGDELKELLDTSPASAVV
ncbi:MAG: hypothetical protein CM1200mP3_02730 [Chloroflexota bacterium]|nr:MAG: hypothetical protein CM1200mP3_02730 [Chloroflexota bacterium]